MKKATTKILLAALSLVMALGIATGSTFAWFTSNRTVTVGAVQAQVVSGTQGLYVAISADGGSTYGEFQTSLDTAKIMTALFGANYATAPTGAVKLDALTTTDNGVTLKNEAGETAAAFSNSSATNPYLEIKLKFRTTVQQDIYLGYLNDAGTAVRNEKDSTIDPVGTYAGTAVKAWKAITTADYGQDVALGAAINARAAHAARVSFNDGTTAKVWAPYDYTTGNNDGLTEQAGFYKGNLAEDYRNNLLGKTGSLTVANLNAVKLLEDAVAKAGTDAGSATKIATTQDNHEGAFDAEVTIRLWIEGTDGDCLNSIFNDTLALNLVFNSITVTP